MYLWMMYLNELQYHTSLLGEADQYRIARLALKSQLKNWKTWNRVLSWYSLWTEF